MFIQKSESVKMIFKLSLVLVFLMSYAHSLVEPFSLSGVIERNGVTLWNPIDEKFYELYNRIDAIDRILMSQNRRADEQVDTRAERDDVVRDQIEGIQNRLHAIDGTLVRYGHLIDRMENQIKSATNQTDQIIHNQVQAALIPAIGGFQKSLREKMSKIVAAHHPSRSGQVSNNLIPAEADGVQWEQSHVGFGAGFNYSNDINFGKVISVGVGQLIKIEFDAFNTEDGFDYVHFWTRPGGKLLASYSGDLEANLPELTGDGHEMFYTWKTDNSWTRSGWRFKYYPADCLEC